MVDLILPMGGYIVNIILIIAIIFLGRYRNPRSTLMWVMVMALMPILGFIFYLLLGQDHRSSQKFDDKIREDDLISDLAKDQIGQIRSEQWHFNNPRLDDYRQLLKLNLRTDDAILTEDNSVETFYWGHEYFSALFRDIENAKESIDIQTYIFKYDKLGKKLICLLEEKSSQGLKVRLLIDGLGGRTLKRKHFKKFSENGGQLAIFAPSILRSINPRINYRNHRKIAVIDDKIGYIGGFNIGNEYMGWDENIGPWRDTHIKIMGGAVIGLKKRFIKDFRFAYKEELDFDLDYNQGFKGKDNGNTAIQVVSSGPDTRFESIKNAMVKMIYSAKKEIIIQSPYFVPDESVLDAIINARHSGVDVSIMIPGNPDHPFVFWVALSYLGELIDLGVKAYLYNEGFHHSKNIIVDDYLSTIGSTNLDIRSFALNFEANAFIYDKEINASLKEQFKEDLLLSTELTIDMYKNRGKITKIKESFSRLLAPIL